MREVRRLERGYARGAGSEEGRLEWSWGRTVEVVLRYMKIKPEFNPTLCDVITVRVQHNNVLLLVIFDDFRGSAVLLCLGDVEAEGLGEEITEPEMKAAIKTIARGKVPGMVGLPVECACGVLCHMY
ncbi:hypothetical protein NDU88_006464 [Pleurodeles waltl]|uniref:Uncharacterized protein n=1 Tax=Pleurodeles waltl TaxID=8319 RepID=A0AAV7QM15_PLEWA|nr:hypothetical protein NDU88_006464 [Pleurodeles waltl]